MEELRDLKKKDIVKLNNQFKQSSYKSFVFFDFFFLELLYCIILSSIIYLILLFALITYTFQKTSFFKKPILFFLTPPSRQRATVLYGKHIESSLYYQTLVEEDRFMGDATINLAEGTYVGLFFPGSHDEVFIIIII